MQFSKSNYTDILKLLKTQFVDFHTPGDGTVLRHDTDDDLQNSLLMAEIESSHGVKSTYFILDTAPYWQPLDSSMWEKLRAIQDMGHEIGWHNNAVTAWIKDGKKNNLGHYIKTPLCLMRDNGLHVNLTAAHGDPLCYELKYVNYNCFGFTSPKLFGYEVPVYDMKEFGLVQDAIHDPHTGYLSDSGGKWSADPLSVLIGWKTSKQRNQLLIHPQWWTL